MQNHKKDMLQKNDKSEKSLMNTLQEMRVYFCK